VFKLNFGALKKIRTFESLGLRDYRLLWLGQLTTSIGQWMDQTARSWLIYEMTGSVLQLGLINAVRGLPLLIFGVVAGTVADRYGRKAQLIIAQTVNGILNVGLAALIFTGHVQVWHIYVTGFLAGTVQAFQQPARQVLINDLVGRDRLLNAVSLNSAAVNVSRSIGPGICGYLISSFGTDVAYLTQGIIYALATIWTVQIRIPESTNQLIHSHASQQRSFISDTREGFAYILNHRLILNLMVLALAPAVLAMPYTSLMPVFAVNVLHGNANTQGLLLTTVGFGAIAGALTIASLGRKQGSGKLLIAGAAGFGLSLMLFSRSPALHIAMIFTFLAGFSNTTYQSQNQTMIQTLATPEVRGRVLGTYMLSRALQPLGSLLAGVLASLLGAPWAVTIMGSSCFLLALGIGLFGPRLWNLNISEDGVVEPERTKSSA
jgi:MFS family permease